jgi:hypothetical protein
MYFRTLVSIAFLLPFGGTLGRADEPAVLPSVDFVSDIQPLFAEHCFECHGGDQAALQGGLRLDLRNAALVGGESAEPAIVPGQPDRSALITRIESEDEDLRMPPADKHARLTAEQVAVLRRWVSEGAPYAQHWAFVVPQAPNDLSPEQLAVDQLVRRKLASHGMQAAPPADAATLCRRLHLDLIGLPPTPQEAEEFARLDAEDRRTAVQATIDRLQASPHFGEKWARHWLDAARYSDSNGFEKDLPRDQWAWRDWVIEAINRDLPYDQFLIEQLAGDLLPNATQDQVVATGFLRNSMVNEEGAIVPEQFRIEELFDRMDCLGKAVFGLSLQCAQCHTHKFDPISQDEYYGIYAFLNNAYEAQSWVYTAEQQQQIAEIQTAVKIAEDELKAQRPAWPDELRAWEESIRRSEVTWVPLKAIEMESTSGLNHPTQEPDLSILTQGHPTTGGDVYAVFQPTLEQITGLRFEALTHGDMPFGGPGRSRYGTWAISELKAFYQLPDSDDWHELKLVNPSADFAEADRPLEAEWSADFDPENRRVCGPVSYLVDGDERTGWRADRGAGLRNQPGAAVVQFAEPLTQPPGTKLKLVWVQKHGGSDNGRSNTQVGRSRFSLTNAADPRAQAIDHAAILASAVPAAQRSEEEQRALFSAWRKTLPDAKAINDRIADQWKRYPKAKTSVLNLAERPTTAYRTTHLYDRGAWDRPKHEVAPHTPAALHRLSAGEKPTRLDFARWAASRESPLAARVAVNRVWQAIFGSGLVETPEDFGTRAPIPLHRELLDWLAVDFMDHGWSQKHLIRTILSSETYQQSSHASAAQLESDPVNHWLARGPRFRMEAEVMRDSALQIAGLITLDPIGGPSIFPPVPQNVLDFNYFKPTYWHPPEDGQRYRRALYVFRKRSMPDPVLSSFDAPNGDLACARRLRSNTPLSALTSLNEPVFVEAAQALAQRVLREGGSDTAQRADYAFRLCTSRGIKAGELEAIEKLLNDSLNRLHGGELQAGPIAFTSLTDPTKLPADSTPNEIAAWTIVCRVLLNLDETLTKS